MASNDFVNIVEVGPRDGLQNIKEVVPTTLKVELIKRLSKTGLSKIEATSFVSPKWIPQLADSKQVMAEISPLVAENKASYPVLVPNLQGLDAAARAGAKEIGLFVSATEGFSCKNINCTIEESLQRARLVAEKALSQGIRIRAYISCVIECPYDGPTSPSSVLKVAKELLDMGCFELSLGDTLGVGTPEDIRRLLTVLLDSIPASKLAGHFHDTFGMAIANVMAAYEMGIRTFDSSISGLGGCPYSPGAKGNLATEDIVYAFHRMGVKTGTDLTELARIGDWIATQLRRPNSSRAGAALIAREQQSLESTKTQTPKTNQWKVDKDNGDYLVHRRGASVRITMNRPSKGNALTSGMLEGLTDLFKSLSKDQKCFRILIAATGKYFCTGMDLGNASPSTRKRTFEQLRDLFQAIDEAPQTSIAVIDGPAFGGGVGLAFACDIRMASEKAAFQLTEVRLGICPAVISKYVFREWSIAFAREAMLSARPVGARELHNKLGAIHVILPSEQGEMETVANNYLDELRSSGPGASSLVKDLARAAWQSQGRPEQDRVVEDAFDKMMTSKEQSVGSEAFKRGVRRTDWERLLAHGDSKL